MTSGARYLWFAPHAGLWPSFRLEHRLADSLARSGRDVTMIHCAGVLDSYCPVMSAQRLSVASSASTKGRVCRDCRHSTRLVTATAAYRSIDLDDVIDEAIRQQADVVMAGVTENTWSELELDGLAIGRYSAYLTMLHHKVPTPTATPEAWTEYLSDLRNAVRVALAMPTILDQYQPTHAVVYNALYPTSRMFMEQSMRRGAQFVGLHAGSYIPARYDTVGIYQHLSASQTAVDSTSIRQSLDIACTPGEIDAVGRQVRELVAGNDPWVYSSAPERRNPAELRASLGLRPDAAVVVALLSSPDETRSSMLVDAEYHRDPERGYSDLTEFVQTLHRLAADAPELDFILRLHPRLIPNKRETVESPDLAAILDALAHLPPNAHINEPGHGISLYDVIGLASAAVNQSSSAGLEFLMLGLPVISYDPVRQNAYPPEFGPCVDRADPAGLASAVRAAVQAGPSGENSVRAVRWYATTQLRAMLHLEPIVTDESADGGVDSAGTAAPIALPSGVAGLVPQGLREHGARWLARRARVQEVPSADSDAGWRSEWLARLDATVGSQVVWEPLIIVRGQPAPQDEVARVEALVAEIRRSLGFDAHPPEGTPSDD